jgi:PAS domain S-box-containing protein
MNRTAVDQQVPLRGWDEDVALRSIVEGTATTTGERFFAALVENLARALQTQGAWVTEYLEESRRLRALAFWMDGGWISDYEIDITGTPCEAVIESSDLVHIPDGLVALYPDDAEIQESGMVSYMGVPLKSADGCILGHMAVVDRRPIPPDPRILALFRIFAARAAAELQRLRAESLVREREEKLGRLLDSAMDAVVELDEKFQVTMLNWAAEKTFQCAAETVMGNDFGRFLLDGEIERLRRLAQTLQAGYDQRRSLWIPGGLRARTAEGGEFPAEATLSCYEMRRHTFYTLILRNVNDRLEAERRIQSLRAETEYLREELELAKFDEIIGVSRPIERVRHQIRQVAETDASVLILGETGTGKELIARAVHKTSRRKDGPLVKVNCAAIPAALVESEFFGHAKGAFTGATDKREGRFALADGGTIFLDEIGELPLDLQSKLLRVLQEGEFEPVGSSQTRTVDVRVVAATNRDLLQAVKDRTFREDLYYRLNVFPIELPPLRSRTDDIPLLAAAFADRLSQRMGRPVEPLTDECVQRLKQYSWPGNVRELENVIERAVITAQAGRMNLAGALPAAAGCADLPSIASEQSPAPIRTVQEMEQLERENLSRALDATNWKIAGPSGAAALLGMKPSTLTSRLKALGLHRQSPG